MQLVILNSFNLFQFKLNKYSSFFSSPSNYAGNICQTLITTTTSPSTPLNCVDSNPANCKLYAANNYCKPIYFVFGVTVLNYCPASCGLCVSSSHSSSTRASTTMSSTTCLDLYSACPTWKSMQWCNLFPVYNVCKKSCNLCWKLLKTDTRIRLRKFNFFNYSYNFKYSL